MSASYQKAQTSTQGAHLAEAVGTNYSRIFILLLLSIFILILFTPLNHHISEDYLLQHQPNLCKDHVVEYNQQALTLEREILQLEKKLQLQNHPTITDSKNVVDTVYKDAQLLSKTRQLYQGYPNLLQWTGIPKRPDF